MPSPNDKPRGTILLVDDEWLMRWSFERALRKHSFEVITAASGREALDAASCRRVDWFIADLKLPDFDGLELLRQAREFLPRARLILITAYGSPDVEREADNLGAKYLAKPFDLDRIIAVILADNV